MSLPLSARATEGGDLFLLTPADAEPSAPAAPLTPGRLPQSGEQYRFHLDMTKCIGCKCCIVACNEQNGNPAEIQWRRVGEIEGGTYPDTMRHYLSMGCNHCLEPTCMTGCPVDAYTKDPLTGIVLHNAERCIGCQYCTWNCSYGVPQYNPERGVVGKCDMCHGRLAEGREPACVSACPEGAIRIEIVDIAEWRSQYASQANAPGLPSADDSISTTRITLDSDLPHDMGRVDTSRVEPEHPHWTLIVMTVFTQLSVGAIATMCISQWLSRVAIARVPAAGVVFIALLALAASTLHLGRPLYAFRALSMWRRSWLSREVLFFSLFSTAAIAYAVLLWTSSVHSAAVAVVATFLGCAGVYASARLYMVAARPAWNNAHTLFEFSLTALLTGTLTASMFISSLSHTFVHAALAGAALSATQQIAKLYWLLRSPILELRATGKLLRYRFLTPVTLRLSGTILIAWMLKSSNNSLRVHILCIVAAIAVELVGRYLFFVSVVPKSMAAPYLKERRAA